MENEPAPEKLSSDELEYLAKTQRQFDCAKVIAESYTQHIVGKYRLKPQDEFDTATGVITRTPEA